MTRRNFIKISSVTAMLLSVGVFPTNAYAVWPTIPKIVVNITLDGGPDFKHLIVPPFSEDASSYGATFWRARASIFNLTSSDSAGLKNAYIENYDEITVDGIVCGVLKECGWLKSEILAKNVAIVSGVVASQNRDHHHSKLILESGSLLTGAHDVGVSGWGGRAVQALGANAISITQGVRLICNGAHALDDKNHDNSSVVTNTDSRNMGLYNYDTQADLDNEINSYKWSSRAILSRSLKSYYAAKDEQIPESSPYKKFTKHEQTLRNFGDQIKKRLDTVTIPTSIEALHSGDNKLNATYFGRQIASLYDSIAAQDILNMRFASLEYSGWDTHKFQKDILKEKLGDIFGSSKGLNTLVDELDKIDTRLYENIAIVISGEFGRQLKSNGDNGTDHGRGNSAFIIGRSVQGGFYGNPFPTDEIARLEVKNEDIEGKTSMFQLYAAVLEWQSQDLGSQVFDLTNEPIEDGLSFSDLFSV